MQHPANNKLPRPKRGAVPFDRPFTRADLDAAGVTVGALRGWRERNDVTELVTGVFVPIGVPITDELRAVYTNRAVVKGTAPVPIAGAAVLHGLWRPPNLHSMLRTTDARRVIPEEHLEQRGTLKVPSLPWTAVQLTRGQKLEGALIAIDSALRRGASLEMLRLASEQCNCWAGISAVFDALPRADSRSESALESWSRGLMIRRGIPVPELQRRMRLRQRTYYADFFWPDAGLIGEADGMSKYSSADVVDDEKRRQGRMQAAGYTVYRWGWPEVAGDTRAWIHGLRRALDRAA